MFDKRVKLIKPLIFVILLFVLRQPVFAGVFEIQDMAIGTAVQARGVVIAEPGVLGQQIFYINGAQIYSYYKDFPELATGDEISVQGVISQSRGEKRIKIKTAGDITILNRGLVVEPVFLSGSDSNKEEMVGRLVKTSGMVIEKTGARIFVKNGDDKEILIYIKEAADIDKSRINEGDQIEATGVLSFYDDELRLLPRSDQDVMVLSKESPVSAPKNEEEPSITVGKMARLGKYRPYFIGSSFVLGAIFVLLLILRKKI